MLILPFLLAASYFPAPVAWDYSQNGVDWVGSCAAGAQSPINLPSKAPAKNDGLKLFFKYPHMGHALQLYNNGHGLAMTMPESYKAGFGLAPSLTDLEQPDAEAYRFWQASFHSPSEHTVEGERMPLEMQLVHERVVGGRELAIISILFTSGSLPSDLLELVIGRGLPKTAWEEATINVASTPNSSNGFADLGGSLQSVLDRSSFFTYEGSLTVPPCTPKVKYYIRQYPVQSSFAQLEQFRELLLGSCPPRGNYRMALAGSTAGVNLGLVNGDGALAITADVPGVLSPTPPPPLTDARRALITDNPDFNQINAGDSFELKSAKTKYQQAVLDHEAAVSEKTTADNELRTATAVFESATGVIDKMDLQWEVTEKNKAASEAAENLVQSETALDDAIRNALVVLENANATKVAQASAANLSSLPGPSPGPSLGPSPAASPSLVHTSSLNQSSSNASMSNATSPTVTVEGPTVMLPHGNGANPFVVSDAPEMVVRVGVGGGKAFQAPLKLTPDLERMDGPQGGPVRQVIIEHGEDLAPTTNTTALAALVARSSEPMPLHLRGRRFARAVFSRVARD